jgi:hypothetical protein
MRGEAIAEFSFSQNGDRGYRIGLLDASVSRPITRTGPPLHTLPFVSPLFANGITEDGIERAL